MVIQRDEPIMIWGECENDADVTVVLGAVTGQAMICEGRFECVFPALSGGEHVSLTVRQGGNTITYNDIAIGDVWIAAGQSNMEFFLRYEKHWEETKKTAFDDGIRMYTCVRKCFAEQTGFQSGVGEWFKEGEEPWETFAAAGYHFAKYLREKTDIPIGIISCNWGGTSASAWLPKERLEKEPLSVYLDDYKKACEAVPAEEIAVRSLAGWAFQKDESHKKEWAKVMYGLNREEQLEYMRLNANNPSVPMGPYNKNRPGCLYENMVQPLLNLKLKGVLWYQGENDVHHADMYSVLLKETIKAWREGFGADIPFLFVQLAPFEQWMALTGEQFPVIRQQQEKVGRDLQGCYMIKTDDIGDLYDIHPKEKREIGRRLALLAIENGMTG